MSDDLTDQERYAIIRRKVHAAAKGDRDAKRTIREPNTRAGIAFLVSLWRNRREHEQHQAKARKQ